MSRQSPETIFLKLTTGNHGAEPSIRFEPQKNLWEVNIRPLGPGVGPIFYLSDSFVSRLSNAYLTTHGKKEAESTV